MQTPVVSVLIPTYNYARFLDETVQSVLSQTFTDFEIIICDNNSTDNTDEVIAKYLSDSRIIYHKNKSNIGLAGNWNKCLELASGTYIKYLCADDKFHPQLLEKFVAAMEKHPTVSLVTCYRAGFGGVTNLFQLPVKGFHSGNKIIKLTLNTSGWLGEPTAVMFRGKNKNIAAFNSKYKWLTDWEMWLHHLTAGDCYIIPEPLAFVRMHAAQITKTVVKSYVNYFEEYEMCKNIKAHNGYNIDTSDIDMNAVMKKRAAKCAKVVYEALPKIYKKENRRLFAKAFKIAFAEGVLLTPLLQQITKKRKRQKENTTVSLA